MNVAVLKTMIENAPETDGWPEPDMALINADEAVPPAFCFDALPSVWANWCHETAQAQGCPVDYVTANLITAASAWLGNSRRVAPSSDWVEPPHIWMANVGKPSEGKTPSQKPFVEVSKKLEHEAEPEWTQRLAEYAKNLETATAKSEVWKIAVKKAVKDGTPSPDRPADAVLPDPPDLPRTIICDATTQEIVNILKGNPKGLLMMRDELSGWIGSFDRYSGAGADRSFYLECWNGGRYVVDLVKHSGNPVRVPYASLAILGGFQPDKLRDALSGADDGFAARFAYVWPKPVPYRPLKQNDDTVSQARSDLLLNAARRLRGLQMTIKDNGDPVPHILRLEPDALALFEEIRRKAMSKARSAKGLATGWHGKTPARALRIALVVEFLAWSAAVEKGEPHAISAASMACAGTYLDYLGGMFERVIGGIAVGIVESDAADIARHLKIVNATVLNERELYQTEGFSYLRDAQRRKEAFSILENAAWIRRPAGQQGKGRKRGDWQINPKLRGAA